MSQNRHRLGSLAEELAGWLEDKGVDMNEAAAVFLYMTAKIINESPESKRRGLVRWASQTIKELVQ